MKWLKRLFENVMEWYLNREANKWYNWVEANDFEWRELTNTDKYIYRVRYRLWVNVINGNEEWRIDSGRYGSVYYELVDKSTNTIISSS